MVIGWAVRYLWSHLTEDEFSLLFTLSHDELKGKEDAAHDVVGVAPGVEDACTFIVTLQEQEILTFKI